MSDAWIWVNRDGLTRSGCFAGKNYYTGVEKNTSYFYPSSPDPDLARIPRQSNPARSPPGHFSKKIDLDPWKPLTIFITSFSFMHEFMIFRINFGNVFEKVIIRSCGIVSTAWVIFGIIKWIGSYHRSSMKISRLKQV